MWLVCGHCLVQNGDDDEDDDGENHDHADCIYTLQLMRMATMTRTVIIVGKT